MLGHFIDPHYFLHSNFLLPLRQHIFRQQRQGIEPAVSCHFLKNINDNIAVV